MKLSYYLALSGCYDDPLEQDGFLAMFLLYNGRQDTGVLSYERGWNRRNIARDIHTPNICMRGDGTSCCTA